MTLNSRILPAALLMTALFFAAPMLAQTPVPQATPAARPAPPSPRTPADAVTPTVKDPNRHAEFLYRLTEGDVGLLFLGDSIMDGWPRKGEYSWLKFAPYNPADFGVSGDRTEHVLWRITNGELEGIHPKVTVIMIGTNNIGQLGTEDPAWAAAGVKKIVDTVQQKLPQSKILLLAVFPRDLAASKRRADVAAINAIISKFDNGTSIRYLDIGKVFLDPAGELPKDVMPDKLHPTAKGYDLWFNAMQPLLVQMMK
jgi:lysophospholipase L1-like esterase